MNFKDALQNDIFRIISQAADNLDVDSYVIGGFVRDYILERGTHKDIDIVAIGSGIALAKQVSKLLPNTPKVKVFKTENDLGAFLGKQGNDWKKIDPKRVRMFPSKSGNYKQNISGGKLEYIKEDKEI